MIVVGDKYKSFLIRLEAFAMEKLNITILSDEEEKYLTEKSCSTPKVYVNDILMLNFKADRIYNRSAFLCAESMIRTTKPGTDKTGKSKNADIINLKKARGNNASKIKKMHKQ